MPICHGLEAGFGTGRRSAGGQSVSARVCGPCAKIIERRCQLIFGHTHTHAYTYLQRDRNNRIAQAKQHSFQLGCFWRSCGCASLVASFLPVWPRVRRY